jgi:hypothetical protein
LIEWEREAVSELCERHHISESEFYDWRETSLAGATTALARQNGNDRPPGVTQPEPRSRRVTTLNDRL